MAVGPPVNHLSSEGNDADGPEVVLGHVRVESRCLARMGALSTSNDGEKDVAGGTAVSFSCRAIINCCDKNIAYFVSPDLF